MMVRGGGSAEIGVALRGEARQMLQWWHHVRDETLTLASFRTSMQPVRQEVERLLEVGQTCGVPKTEGPCREIFKRRRALWPFVRHEGVDPTKHAAETAIRPGVLWRKGSFGTHRPEGSCFVETMMTVVATLKHQQRHVLDYLTAACAATFRGELAPSWLPTPAGASASCIPRHSSINHLNGYLFLNKLFELRDSDWVSNHPIMVRGTNAMAIRQR